MDLPRCRVRQTCDFSHTKSPHGHTFSPHLSTAVFHISLSLFSRNRSRHVTQFFYPAHKLAMDHGSMSMSSSEMDMDQFCDGGGRVMLPGFQVSLSCQLLAALAADARRPRPRPTAREGDVVALSLEDDSCQTARGLRCVSFVVLPELAPKFIAWIPALRCLIMKLQVVSGSLSVVSRVLCVGLKT